MTFSVTKCNETICLGTIIAYPADSTQREVIEDSIASYILTKVCKEHKNYANLKWFVFLVRARNIKFKPNKKNSNIKTEVSGSQFFKIKKISPKILNDSRAWLNRWMTGFLI